MAKSEFDQLQSDYLKRLSRQLRAVPASLREEAIREVEAHIEDGCRKGNRDLATLRTVLERLGCLHLFPVSCHRLGASQSLISITQIEWQDIV